MIKLNRLRGSPATPYPFFACLIKQAFLYGAGVVLFAAGICTDRLVTITWPSGPSLLNNDQQLETLVAERLKGDLKLDHNQMIRMTPILNAACSDFRMLAEERKARRLEILDEIGTSILPDLNPDQQKRLEGLEEKWRSHDSRKSGQRIVALF